MNISNLNLLGKIDMGFQYLGPSKKKNIFVFSTNMFTPIKHIFFSVTEAFLRILVPNSNQCGYDKPNRLLHYQPNSPVKITEHDEKRIVRNRDAYCQHDCYQTIAFHEFGTCIVECSIVYASLANQLLGHFKVLDPCKWFLSRWTLNYLFRTCFSAVL